MNPGLPGLGIGGLFYLISALAMPLIALTRQLRGEPARWCLALRQAAMAAGILSSIALVFWVLDAVLGPQAVPAGATGTFIAAVGGVRVSVMMLTLTVLATVLLAMQVARMIFAPKLPVAAQRISRSTAQHAYPSQRPQTVALGAD
jgi:hypothetical protein